jgi:hypothetical protein
VFITLELLLKANSLLNRLLPSLLLLVLVSTAGIPAAAAIRLKPETRKAFDHYAKLTEQRVEKELHDGKRFLWTDFQSSAAQADLQRRLKAGEVIMERLKTLENGREIEAPDGMIHHWVGVAYIPGAHLQQVVSLVQDYDSHAKIYQPDVAASKLVQRRGDDFKIFLRFLKKKVITSVVNTEHDVHYFQLSPTRMGSNSFTTKVTELENYGEDDQKELAPGEGNGFLWALNSYWRFEERDGGVYVQCEAISLTRDIPTGLGWLVKPFITSVPKESLQLTLDVTRKSLTAKK